MELEQFEARVKWWESFADALKTETQYFHDYWNDLDARKSFDQIIPKIKDESCRWDLVKRIKMADEIFINNSVLVEQGITGSKTLLPDADWIYFRKPKHADRDFDGKDTE